jgi:hypothetical protein
VSFSHENLGGNNCCYYYYYYYFRCPDYVFLQKSNNSPTLQQKQAPGVLFVRVFIRELRHIPIFASNQTHNQPHPNNTSVLDTQMQAVL